MGVTTKVKYKTSDNKYYDTEKEATISQNRINSVSFSTMENTTIR